MNHSKIIAHALFYFISFSIFTTQLVASENESANYQETILVLQELYKSEIVATKAYSRFAQKADEEEYYSVARLFKALSESESVHAKNFKNILNELGLEPARFTETDTEICDTKSNLKWALKIELAEIDTHYPELINRIKSEENEKALRYITYAWESEMQHRDLLNQMESGLWLFYGRILDKLKEADMYHVCQGCGSTVFELPEKSCIICGSPASMYKQIE